MFTVTTVLIIALVTVNVPEPLPGTLWQVKVLLLSVTSICWPDMLAP